MDILAFERPCRYIPLNPDCSVADALIPGLTLDGIDIVTDILVVPTVDDPLLVVHVSVPVTAVVVVMLLHHDMGGVIVAEVPAPYTDVDRLPYLSVRSCVKLLLARLMDTVFPLPITIVPVEMLDALGIVGRVMPLLPLIVPIHVPE